MQSVADSINENQKQIIEYGENITSYYASALTSLTSLSDSSLSRASTLIERNIKTLSEGGLQDTRDYIFEIAKIHLQEYYDEYSPKYYRRTYQFLESLVKLGVNVKGNSFDIEVKIDEDYLNYEYPGSPQFGERNIPATGLMVAEWANVGSHGGTVYLGESHFWQDTLDDLGGESGIKKFLAGAIASRL